MTTEYERLASYRRLCERLGQAWPDFQRRRAERLVQGQRLGHAAERVAEQILEDLFVGPLDWHLADVNYQVEFADMVLTRLGVRHLIIEAKRPGALAWNRVAVESALRQAAGYARRQKVRTIAVSDGQTLYAADVTEAGLRDRVLVKLDSPVDVSLWWLSLDGIYRPRTDVPHAFALLPEALLSNYRGAHATRIPEGAIPDVLVRLAGAAHALGRLPGQAPSPAPVYVGLALALAQLGRLPDLEDRDDLAPPHAGKESAPAN